MRRSARWRTALLLCGVVVLALQALQLQAAAAPARGKTAAPARGNDTDRDGVPDAVEAQAGTDPLKVDTDGDGVPDGVEDRNRDGVVDPGESDPRVHGLFPGTSPHIPEPMVFDLVRGLGARQGELESNVLLVSPLGRRAGVAWAPELEYAFARNHAVEIEIPIQERTVKAVKAAVQGTLPGSVGRFIHGWQLLAEYVFDRGLEGTPLYLAGLRLSRAVSVFAMAGVRLTWVADAPAAAEYVVNPSVFFDLSETLTLGVESNLWGDRDQLGLRVIPQVHVQVGRHARVQGGGGILLLGGQLSPIIGLRLIAEK